MNEAFVFHKAGTITVNEMGTTKIRDCSNHEKRNIKIRHNFNQKILVSTVRNSQGRGLQKLIVKWCCQWSMPPQALA